MISILPDAKALYCDKQYLYIAKGYTIYRLNVHTNELIVDGKIIDAKYTFLSRFSRLLNRLLRIEPATMLLLKNGSRIVSAKKGIFLAKKGSKNYLKTFNITRGNKPLNLCLASNGDLYFGEYILNGTFADTERTEVHIYRSKDNGQTWSICYTFPKNTIRHIHGIFYDKYTDKIWITTGDRDNESMIASSSDGFRTLEIIKQGKQKYRAVTLLFYEDFIVYGTDTEHEENYIYSIDRATGEETRLVKLQGSVLMATQNHETGNAAISTAVEPSKVNHHSYAHIWFSADGKNWKDIYSAKKDILHPKYFQYGRITFPTNALEIEKHLIFSGHALKDIDNNVLFWKY